MRWIETGPEQCIVVRVCESGKVQDHWHTDRHLYVYRTKAVCHVRCWGSFCSLSLCQWAIFTWVSNCSSLFIKSQLVFQLVTISVIPSENCFARGFTELAYIVFFFWQVYKLRIENSITGDCWFVFRRYTDFVRLFSKVSSIHRLHYNFVNNNASIIDVVHRIFHVSGLSD